MGADRGHNLAETMTCADCGSQLGSRGKQGRVYVIIAMVLAAFGEVVTQLAGGVDLVTLVIRGGLLVLLLTFLWLGHRWARWVVIVLAGLAGILAGILSIVELHLPVLALGVLTSVSAALLLLPGVKDFQAYQRAKK